MSHNRQKEWNKFYNNYDRDAKREVKSAYCPDETMSLKTTLTGVLGSGKSMGRFDPWTASAQTARRIDPELTPPKIHHVKWGLGVSTTEASRKNNFTELPGRTFNSDSWNAYSVRADQAKALSSPQRSMRR
eukprot:gene27160-2399_t